MKLLSIEEAAKVGRQDEFFLNVRLEAIPRLAKRGLLASNTGAGGLQIVDDATFRKVMGYGVEEFVYNQQGWSFVAIRAPISQVAEALNGGKQGVLRYDPQVAPQPMEEEASGAAAEDRRYAFLLKTKRTDWTVLVLTVHWFMNADAVLATMLAAYLSAALGTRAVAAWDDDFSGSTAVVCDKGQKTAVIDDEDWIGFYEFFYEQGIAVPECFIASMSDDADDSDDARLLMAAPSEAERVDLVVLKVPEALRSDGPHVLEKLGMMAEAVADDEADDEEAFRSSMVDGIWSQAQALLRVQRP